MHILARGRVAKWDREKLNTLSTPELRQLLVNAERLKEAEVAALCNELLSGRPRGHAPVRRHRPKGTGPLVHAAGHSRCTASACAAGSGAAAACGPATAPWS